MIRQGFTPGLFTDIVIDNLPGIIISTHTSITGRDGMTKEEFIDAVVEIEQEFHIDLSRLKTLYDDEGEDNDAADEETKNSA